MPDGGDYLRVLSRQSAGHSLGSVMGTVIARKEAEGSVFERVFIPRDRAPLLGYVPITEGHKADGSVYSVPWQPYQEYADAFTAVPLIDADYDPVLSTSELQSIENISRVQRITGNETGSFSIADQSPGASGDWVLYSIPTVPRKYILVPVELSPTGRRP